MYDLAVRRILAIVLILMVPVRVFAAESLGMCMLQMSVQHQQSVASMPDDCPMFATENAPAEHQKSDGGGCESCQLCMPLAGPETAAIAPPVRIESVAPIAPVARFRSADAHPALKPPIS